MRTNPSTRPHSLETAAEQSPQRQGPNGNCPRSHERTLNPAYSPACPRLVAEKNLRLFAFAGSLSLQTPVSPLRRRRFLAGNPEVRFSSSRIRLIGFVWCCAVAVVRLYYCSNYKTSCEISEVRFSFSFPLSLYPVILYRGIVSPP